MDWKAHKLALRNISEGKLDDALRQLQELMRTADNPLETAVLMMNKASCMARKGAHSSALNLLIEARTVLGDSDRLAESQIAMVEAAVNVLRGDFVTAVGQYESIGATYADLLAQPEHQDFLNEFLARYSIALVHADKHRVALVFLQKLFANGSPEDEQQMLLYYGIALASVGQTSDARTRFSLAAKGADSELAESAIRRMELLGPIQ